MFVPSGRWFFSQNKNIISLYFTKALVFALVSIKKLQNMTDNDVDKVKAMKIASAKRILQAYQMKEKKKEPQAKRNGHMGDIIACTKDDSKAEIVCKAYNSAPQVKLSVGASLKEVSEEVVSVEEHCQNLNEAIVMPSTNSIEILIKEKSALSTSLLKCQSDFKEKVFQIEELSERFRESQKRVEDMDKCMIEMQNQILCLFKEKSNLETQLMEKVENADILEKHFSEQQERIEELKKELTIEISKREKIEKEIKEKDCELKLSQIRVCEMSDENSVKMDDRIESLTQAKFVHEQQINDLQTMVQQLETEREQSNQQYQNYVQQLNKKIKQLSEKNDELVQTNGKLSERECSLINHVNEMEKQMQILIAKREACENESKKAEGDTQNSMRLAAFIKERDALNIEIQNCQKKMAALEESNRDKDSKIIDLESTVNNFFVERPADSQLLARIESEKVTASIAMTQNEELKKQLDEIQRKLIDVTNDKVELVNVLHAEQHTNREIRANYSKVQEELQKITEKLHFKDEEMIRLTHENYELRNELHNFDIVREKSHRSEEINGVLNYEDVSSEAEKAEIEQEVNETSKIEEKASVIPTPEAMKKLENRFKSLMNDVANLTDEKQRLEHIVTQLQGETETIGEYITLYQTQRRLLKQREIEKDIQEITSPNSLPYIEDTSGKKNHLYTSNETSHQPEEIVNKINTLITELEETNNLKLVAAIDHCPCCSGKFETV